MRGTLRSCVHLGVGWLLLATPLLSTAFAPLPNSNHKLPSSSSASLPTREQQSSSLSTIQQLASQRLHHDNNNNNNIQAAVIVPGFLTGGDAFRTLAANLTARGIPTVAVPMPAWHWIPCLGGRSMRPLLERLDMTVRHVAAGNMDRIPAIQYSLADLWVDFWTTPGGVAKVGGSDKVVDYPVVNPRGTFPLPDQEPKGKIALIGHSAGGWISRIYLSDRSYGGKIYGGQDLVHSLVTLGSPHLQVPSPAFEGVAWVNEEEVLTSMNQLAVGGTGFKGGEWGALTQGSYAFCCANGTDGTDYDGDGVTPIQSALAWKGAQHLVVQNVTHFCWSEVWGSRLVAPELTEDHARGGHPWYGDDIVLDQWADFLRIDALVDEETPS